MSSISNALAHVEAEIARKLAEASASGELKTAESYGKPLQDMDAWADTPEEFRMAFKVLKNSGFAPPEVLLFHERAALAERLRSESDPSRKIALQSELAAMDQKISLRLDALRSHGKL